MEQVLTGLGVIIINSLIMNFLSKRIKLNILDYITNEKIPTWISVILILVVFAVLFACIIVAITSGFVMYNLFIEQKFGEVIKEIIVVMFADVFVGIVKLPDSKSRHRHLYN